MVRSSPVSVLSSVIVRFVVEEEGRPGSRIHFEKAAPPGLATAAREVVEVMRFRPAHVGGLAVPVIVTLPVMFHPGGR